MSEVSINKWELMGIIYEMEKAKGLFEVDVWHQIEVSLSDDKLEAYEKPVRMVERCISRLKRLTD
jgi:hypothetical protein